MSFIFGKRRTNLLAASPMTSSAASGVFLISAGELVIFVIDRRFSTTRMSHWASSLASLSREACSEAVRVSWFSMTVCIAPEIDVSGVRRSWGHCPEQVGPQLLRGDLRFYLFGLFELCRHHACDERGGQHTDKSQRIAGESEVECKIRIGKNVIYADDREDRRDKTIKIAVGKSGDEEYGHQKEHVQKIVAI